VITVTDCQYFVLTENKLNRQKNHATQKMRKTEIVEIHFFSEDTWGRKRDHRPNEDKGGKVGVTDM